VNPPKTEEESPKYPFPNPDVVSNVLSFYGSELTSHAAIMVGFIVALFTLMQLLYRSGISTMGPTATATSPLAIGLVTFTMWGIIYSGIRITYYGILSGVLMHGIAELWDKYVERSLGKAKRLPHGQVNEFAYSVLMELRSRRFLYERRAIAGKPLPVLLQPTAIVSLMLAFAIALIILYGIAV
jgi:hypothetical protein